MTSPQVGILMGSDSDFPVMEAACKMLDYFKIAYEVKVSSAHRTPKQTSAYAQTARERGIRALIIGAGAAAHLAGVVASETTLPVIGVPIDASPLKGVDALYATVMMPGGIPVATMAIGKAGAKNAAIYVASMFSMTDKVMADRLKQYRTDMVAQVQAKSEALQSKLKS
ncbi:MAG: 5-(carboxyamino)imidazole ribonucleotide mutase [Acidobacteria bacterium]|nr:MAG: 5-(carboxyamino)imidazole ribonucleotide mutase [Acidobacteriota bacterium]PIE89689.1 MAG: 5-(carboxyamino)imidazole ribonucleotide mutase [Acidobacteriota bacterium]